jgi:hypothetical protein
VASATAPGAELAGVDPTIDDGGLAIYCVDVLARPGAPSWLSITLVWTDPPGSPAAAYALVNDLTLEVSPPPPANASAPLPGIGAATLFGNNDPAAKQQLPDTRNNVEKIYLPSPPATLAAGGARLAAPYSVRVRGSLVFQGPQAYSLVITGLGVSLAAAGSCGDDPFSPPAAPDARLKAYTTATASLGAALAVTIVAAVAWHFRAALPCGGAAKAPRMGIFNRVAVAADDGRASLPLLPTQAGAPTFPPAGSM